MLILVILITALFSMLVRFFLGWSIHSSNMLLITGNIMYVSPRQRVMIKLELKYVSISYLSLIQTGRLCFRSSG